jgi:hypothetical protein
MVNTDFETNGSPPRTVPDRNVAACIPDAEKSCGLQADACKFRNGLPRIRYR